MRPVAGALVLALTATGCALPMGGPAGPGRPVASEDLPPAGHGSLRQEEITLSLRSGDLQIKVTPLEEWMIRLTAPDTYRRLADLASAHRAGLERESGVAAPALFLVAFFSDVPDVPYEPEDLHVLDRGRRFRPLDIRPLSGGFGSRRLAQRETRMAVYAFEPAVRLDMGLVVEYGDVRNTQWDGILQRLQSELARVRARGVLKDGGGHDCGARPRACGPRCPPASRRRCEGVAVATLSAANDEGTARSVVGPVPPRAPREAWSEGRRGTNACGVGARGAMLRWTSLEVATATSAGVRLA